MKNFIYIFFLYTAAVFYDSWRSKKIVYQNRNPAAVTFKDLNFQTEKKALANKAQSTKQAAHLQIRKIKKCED